MATKNSPTSHVALAQRRRAGPSTGRLQLGRGEWVHERIIRCVSRRAPNPHTISEPTPARSNVLFPLTHEDFQGDPGFFRIRRRPPRGMTGIEEFAPSSEPASFGLAHLISQRPGVIHHSQKQRELCGACPDPRRRQPPAP